jgi:hypothetical protein
MHARSVDPPRTGCDHIGNDRLGVPALHLRHAGTNRVPGEPPAHEHDEPVEARDAVPSERERIDRELELLISLDGRRHPGRLDDFEAHAL